MATLSDIRARVRTLTGIQSASVLPDNQVDAFINEAQFTILSSADWPFLQETVSAVVPADTDTVSLTLSGSAQRVLDVFAVTDAGSKPWQLFERSAPFIVEDANGTPREFSWDPATSTLGVFPASSEPVTVTVRVVLEPALLVADVDVCAIPDQFVHSVSYLAASRVLEREADETDRAARFSVQSFEAATQMRRSLMTSARGSVVLGGRRNYRRSLRRGAW